MTRQETIHELSTVLHENTGRPMSAIRVALETMSTDELEGALQEHQEQLASKLAELHDLQEKRIRIDAERAAAFAMHNLPKQQEHQAESEAQARAQFADICRQLGISNSEANFRLVFDSFNGSLLDVAAIKSLVASGNLSFIPATEEEQQQWLDQELTALAEFVVDGLRGHQIGRYVTSRPLYETFDAPNRKQHIEWMKNLGLDRLKEIAEVIQQNQVTKRQAGYTTRVPSSQSPGKSPAMQQYESELARQYQQEVIVSGKPPLPKVWRNSDGSEVPLDATFIRREDRATFSVLGSKWGWSQVNARLHGIKQVGNIIFQGEI
jgi:DNA-binding transcriptional MerR regulator